MQLPLLHPGQPLLGQRERVRQVTARQLLSARVRFWDWYWNWYFQRRAARHYRKHVAAPRTAAKQQMSRELDADYPDNP